MQLVREIKVSFTNRFLMCIKFVGKFMNLKLVGGFKYFLFSPLPGKWSNLTHVFQMGWFNHQLVNLFNGYFHGFSHGFPWFGILISPDKGEFSDASASNGSNSNFAWTIAYAPCAFHWNSRKLGIPCWYHPCRRYFPTFGWFFMVNIGKYTIDAVGFWYLTVN